MSDIDSSDGENIDGYGEMDFNDGFYNDNYDQPLIDKANEKNNFTNQLLNNDVENTRQYDGNNRFNYNFPEGTQHYFICAFYTNDMSKKTRKQKLKLYLTTATVMKTIKNPFTHCTLIDMNNHSWDVQDGGFVRAIYQKKFTRGGYGNFQKVCISKENYKNAHMFLRKQEGKPFDWKSFWWNFIPFGIKNCYVPVNTHGESWFCSSLCTKIMQVAQIIPNHIAPNCTHPHKFYDLIIDKSTACDNITAINCGDYNN